MRLEVGVMKVSGGVMKIGEGVMELTQEPRSLWVCDHGTIPASIEIHEGTD